MTEKKQDELLGWFKASLSSQRAGLHLLLLRLKGMAVRVGSSLSMNKKFANLMDQIAAEQEKERRIIDKIEALEKHHRKLRKQNLLQRLALEAKLKREALRERMEHDEEFWFNRSRKKQNEPERDYLELLLFLYVLSSFSRSFARFFTWFKPKRESQKPVPK